MLIKANLQNRPQTARHAPSNWENSAQRSSQSARNARKIMNLLINVDPAARTIPAARRPTSVARRSASRLLPAAQAKAGLRPKRIADAFWRLPSLSTGRQNEHALAPSTMTTDCSRLRRLAGFGVGCGGTDPRQAQVADSPANPGSHADDNAVLTLSHIATQRITS